MIKFLLNRQLQVEESIDPNMMVLNYLRYHTGKTGTKEGCASGDCGACTVVLGELSSGTDNGEDGQQIVYKSINSCLTFVSALHGKQLITVEDLQQGNKLHPAQQAMVDQHGSQCGFCTPGFVMSLFALGKNKQNPNKADIEQALSGNLCRCTGYRPIVDAAHAMYELMYEPNEPDQFEQLQQQILQQLRDLRLEDQQRSQEAILALGNKKTFNPRSIDELASLYAANPDARLLAGGTDLALEVTRFHRDIDTLITIGEVDALKQIQVTDSEIKLGAAAPLSQCYEVLTADYPDFGALLHRFASLQIRNQGTLGGNIGNASPVGDAPPALIALNASIALRQGNSRRTIRLEDYFIDYKITARQPGEFIEQIIVPRAISNTQTTSPFRSYKISKRIDDDISAVLGCFNLHIEEGLVKTARIAFGGLAAIPRRASHCEAALVGAPWNKSSIEFARSALAKDFDPISDFRASKEYRMLTARNMLNRYFVELNSPEVATRVFSKQVVDFYQPCLPSSAEKQPTSTAGGSNHD